MLDGRDARQRQEEAKVIREFLIATRDRLTARKVFRLEGFAPSVKHRTQTLLALLDAHEVVGESAYLDHAQQLARIIDQNDCGVTIEVGEGEKLAQTIAEMRLNPDQLRRMGTNARGAVENKLSRGAAFASWEKLIERLELSVATV